MTSSTETHPPEIWRQALDALQDRIKPHNFDMWLRPIQCKSIDGQSIVLNAPNRYIKEWFEDNYLPVVLQELRSQTKQEFSVHFELEDPPVLPPIPALEIGSEQPQIKAGEPTSNDWGYELNERYTFDTFVVGPSNQLAHAASHAVAEIPAAKYNPLFIYGGVGLGKTHLLCAIGQEIRRREPDFRVAYLSSERFMNEYINLLRANRIEEFREKFREKCDVLLMDDIQFIAGKDRTQDEFFHTFNSLYDSNRQIVVTSDKYPHEIPELEERLRTRFQWGLIADIQQPELETRVAILKKKAEMEHIPLPDDVALYLATNIKSNVRELEGSLIRLAALASLKQADISVDFASETLKQFLSQASASLTIEAIQKEVASYFNLKVADLRSSKRHKAVARPRQIAMFLCRKLTDSSFPEIGQRFGGKDHSTVISACNKIKDLSEKDLSVRTAVETLERQLQL
jgi:chromosomal replication initiator protein